VERIIEKMGSHVQLHKSYESLDASHLWIVYWVSAVMDMFKTEFVTENKTKLLNLIEYFIKTEEVSLEHMNLRASNSTYQPNTPKANK